MEYIWPCMNLVCIHEYYKQKYIKNITHFAIKIKYYSLVQIQYNKSIKVLKTKVKKALLLSTVNNKFGYVLQL